MFTEPKRMFEIKVAYLKEIHILLSEISGSQSCEHEDDLSGLLRHVLS
jgi:hypothetical protein